MSKPVEALILFTVVKDELHLRNYSPKTIKAYLSCLRSFQHHKPKHYLFEGVSGRNHLAERSGQSVFERVVKKPVLLKSHRAQFEALICNPSARKRSWSEIYTGIAWTPEFKDHWNIHPCQSKGTWQDY